MNALYAILLSGVLTSVGAGSGNGVMPLPTPAGSLMQGVKTGEGALAPSNTSASYLSQFTAVWYLEEGTTNARVNSAGTSTCGGTGSNCNLSRGGGTVNDTTNFIQGAASNSFDGVGDSLTCTSCSALNPNDESISYGCFVYHDVVGDSAHDGVLIGKYDGTSGYEMNQDYRVFNSAWVTTRCKVNGFTNTSHTLLSYFFSGSWIQYVCVFDALNQQNKLYALGMVQDSKDTWIMTPSSSDFKLGTGTSYGDAQVHLDECFFYKGVLSARDVCKLCSCGPDGSLCACGGTTWANTGRNATYCSSCELPQSCNTPFGVD